MAPDTDTRAWVNAFADQILGLDDRASGQRTFLLPRSEVPLTFMGENRKVIWEGFFNTRDLGGLTTRDGRTVRQGAFIRSADLRFVTDKGWESAYDAGVRTVVDLRNPDEVAPTPGEGPTAQGGSASFPATPLQASLPAGMERLTIPLDDVEDIPFWRDINRRRLNGTPLYYRPFLERKG